MDKIAYSLDELREATGIGRTSLYEALRDGRLKAVKSGRRTLVLADDAREFVASLPERPAGDAA